MTGARLACLVWLGILALPAAASAGGSAGAAAVSPLEQRLGAVATQPAPAAAAAPRPVASNVRLERCKEAKPGGMCGTVTVPLDRLDPSKGTLDLFFLLFPHRGSAPTSEAILVTEGGPGFSVTQDEFLVGYYRDIFDPLMKNRDLIMLDQRGVGRSGAINCPELQKGAKDLPSAIRACGAQLGPTASLYGSDNVALDVEAVRAALGYELLDFYGASNAALDIQAYAARFPERLRSVILDSPQTTLGFEGFDPLTLQQWLKAAELICRRSASCSAERGGGGADIAWLAERLREKPVKGVGRDADGNRHRVRVTEAILVWSMLGVDFGGYVAPSELGAAADALRAGDEAPLLRLAAETDGPLFVDEGRPREFSAGDNLARFCNDFPMPWDKGGTREQRLAQFEAARAALPADAFAPISIDAWLAPLPVGPLGPDLCIDWPAPSPGFEPPFPDGFQFPATVPALVLTGDLDLSTAPATARLLADAWPNSELVEIVNAGHHTGTPLGAREGCAVPIIIGFIDDLGAGRAKCARDVFAMWPSVGRFAETAAKARPARPAGGDNSSTLERKVATVAAATATDAIRRTFMRSGPGAGPALRGGTFKTAFENDAAVSELDGARFARDVAVSGRIRYEFESEIFRAKLHVRGPGGSDGRLRMRGIWFPFRHDATTFKVQGVLGGDRINVRVPAS